MQTQPATRSSASGRPPSGRACGSPEAPAPDRDASIAPVVARVKNPEVPQLIQAIYGVKAPATPRNDLAEIFLTGITTKAGGPIKADLNSQLNNADVISSRFRPSEMLRLNLSVKPTANPNRLGVLAGDLQGFPNGRRLTDDVVDIELQALEGAAQTGKLVDALAKGDAVNANDNPFAPSFPYLSLPNVGAVNKGGGTGAVFREMRTGGFDEQQLEEQLNRRGLMNRLLNGLTKSVRKPWQIYPIGLLFGLGFDTATEVGLLVLAGGAAAFNLPFYAVLVLPILLLPACAWRTPSTASS